MFLPLYSRLKESELLEQPTRHRIHGYLIGNPGAYYDLIKEDLGIPNGHLIYHLKQLADAHLIYSRKDGIKRRFYPVAIHVPICGEVYLQKVQEEILGVIETNPGINQKEIASSMNISRQVACYHLTKMGEEGIIRMELDGRECEYYLVENTDN